MCTRTWRPTGASPRPATHAHAARKHATVHPRTGDAALTRRLHGGSPAGVTCQGAQATALRAACCLSCTCRDGVGARPSRECTAAAAAVARVPAALTTTMPPKSRRAQPDAGSTECVYAADGKCDGGFSQPLAPCVACGRLVHPSCAACWGGHEEDVVHCAAQPCRTYNEDEATKAAQTMAARSEADAAADQLPADDQPEAEAAAKAVGDAQAAAAGQVPEALVTTTPPVGLPAAPASVAETGTDSLPPAVTEEAPRANDAPAGNAALRDNGDGVPLVPSGQAADAAPGVQDLGNVAALTPAPPGQRPDGSYKCDAPECSRSADNASVVVVQACAKCGVIQLCAVCKTSTACSALTELHEQDDEVTVCAGCFPLYMSEQQPEYWLGCGDDGRDIIREAAAALHTSMLATRSQRMTSGGGGGGGQGVGMSALGDTVQAAATQAVRVGTLVWHAGSQRVAYVHEVDVVADNMKVAWLPGNEGFQPIMSDDLDLDTFPLTARVLVPLRDVVANRDAADKAAGARKVCHPAWRACNRVWSQSALTRRCHRPSATVSASTAR